MQLLISAISHTCRDNQVSLIYILDLLSAHYPPIPTTMRVTEAKKKKGGRGLVVTECLMDYFLTIPLKIRNFGAVFQIKLKCSTKAPYTLVQLVM